MIFMYVRYLIYVIYIYAKLSTLLATASVSNRQEIITTEDSNKRY